MKESLVELLDELITSQHQKMFKIATKLKPEITSDDILQPYDFPELENNPLFRYEEGVWAGLLEAKTACLRFQKEKLETLNS